MKRYYFVGLDLSTSATGYALCSVEGDKLRLLQSGVIKSTLKGKREPLEKFENMVTLINKEMEHLLEVNYHDGENWVWGIEDIWAGPNTLTLKNLGRLQGGVIQYLFLRGFSHADITLYPPAYWRKKIGIVGKSKRERVKVEVRRQVEKAFGTLENVSIDTIEAVGICMCMYIERQGDLYDLFRKN